MKMKKLLALALCLVLACSLLPTAALAREDEAEVSDWTELQQALSDGASVITLTDDITSTAPLTIGNGVTVTVDLNNHTLDRNLTSGVNNGCVIKVESGGSLTLTNGTVTGGFNKDCGGGIVNKGTLVLDTMTVTGNTSSKQGGGIYNEGVITANKTYITSNKSLSTAATSTASAAAAFAHSARTVSSA